MIRYDMPDKEYFAIEALSNSGIKDMLISPKYFRERVSTSTAAMRLGTLIHALLLDPDEMDNFAIYDGKTWASKGAKEFASANSMKSLFLSSELERAQLIVDRHAEDPILPGLLNTKMKEFVIQNNSYGIPCKAKIDFYKGTTLGDIKTCESLSTFRKSIFNYKYYIQDNWYTRMAVSEGLVVKRFIFVAIETKEPYDIGYFATDHSARLLADKEIDSVIPRYRDCLKTDVWPGQVRAIETVETPGWLLRDL